MAGKGSAPRPVDGAKFRAGWERAFPQRAEQAPRPPEGCRVPWVHYSVDFIGPEPGSLEPYRAGFDATFPKKPKGSKAKSPRTRKAR